MKFSIIIPNYNKAEYIEECLNSVINQDINKSKYEILFIDDESTDNSLEIAKKFNEKIEIINMKKCGAGGARNKGIDIAKGDYIVFLDSDDYLYSNTVLSELDKQINNQDIIFLNFIKNKFGNITEIVDDKTDIFEKIKSTKLLGCPTKCFKRSVIGNTRFPCNQRYEDINFTLENLCKANTYDYFNDFFFTYRKTENSNTTSEINAEAMTDLLIEITKLYYLCIKYPQYKEALLYRIKHDRLNDRMNILNKLIETGNNTFNDKF